MAGILGICASPRKGGNSDLILDAFLDGARSRGPCSIKKIYLIDLEIEFCKESDCCFESGECDKDDDMRLIFKGIDDADIIVIAAPVYFGNIPAQLKLAVDRFQPYWVKKEILKKPPLTEKKRRGVFLCVSGAEKEDFFTSSRQVIKNLFSVLDIEYRGDLYCGGVNDKGEIKSKAEALSAARALGEKLAKSR